MEEVRAPGRGMTLRCARALAVASLAWGTTSSAHLLAGGSAPGGVEMLVLALVTAWLLVAVVGGTPSRVRMVLALVAAQGVLHVLMELLGEAGAEPSTGIARSAAGHHGHADGPGAHAPGPTGPAAPLSGGHEVDLLPGPAMIGAHLAAAVLLGLVLVHGENLFRSTVRLLAAVLLPLTAAARDVLAAVRAAVTSLRRPERVRRARVASVRPDRQLLDVVARGVVRRGPPAFA